MGGIALRAPVLATLFLIVALATLAMPGSANFVGEFLILLGLFKTKLVFAIIAFTGVVMAACTRCACSSARCTTASARRWTRARSAWRDVLVLAPLVAVILFLALYPQLVLHRSEGSVRSAVAPARIASGQRAYALAPAHTASGARGSVLSHRHHPGGTPVSLLLATAHLHGPHIDYAAISPLIALLGGPSWCCCVGLLGSRFAREQLVPLLTLVRSATALGLTIWQWNDHFESSPGRCGSTTWRSC